MPAYIVYTAPLAIKQANGKTDPVITRSALDTTTVVFGTTPVKLTDQRKVSTLEGFQRLGATLFEGDLSGTASLAAKLATPCEVTLTGDIEATFELDGSKPVTVQTKSNVALNPANAIWLYTGNATSPKLGFKDRIRDSSIYFQQVNEQLLLQSSYRSLGSATTLLTIDQATKTLTSPLAATFEGDLQTERSALVEDSLTVGGDTHLSGTVHLDFPAFDKIHFEEGSSVTGLACTKAGSKKGHVGFYDFTPGGLGWLVKIAKADGECTVYGDLYAERFQRLSDRRAKDNPVKAVARPIPVRAPYHKWTLKKNGVEGRGVIAQDVLAIAPEYVCENEEGYLTIDTADVALESVYYTHQEVLALRRYIDVLEERLTRLEKRR